MFRAIRIFSPENCHLLPERKNLRILSHKKIIRKKRTNFFDVSNQVKNSLFSGV
jgi:hypothetical protein